MKVVQLKIYGKSGTQIKFGNTARCSRLAFSETVKEFLSFGPD